MRNKKWGGFLLATILAAIIPACANAVTVDIRSTTLSENQNSPKVLIVQRSITGVKNYVNTSFRYELVEDESNPAAVENIPPSGVLYVSGQADETTNTVSGSMAITLSQLRFSALGDYKFILREISSADPDNYPVDDSDEYYVYVSVRNDMLAGVPTGGLVATMSLQVRNHDEGAKTSPVFTSQAVRTHIELSKNVTGNLANTEEYFKFLVTINGREGDEFEINGQDSSVTYGGDSIATSSTYVVGDNGVEVYLRHGQTITIGLGSDDLNEIPINAEYTIEEIDASDYSTTVDGEEGKVTSTKLTAALLEGGELPESNQTEFINHKESAVLTGITLAMIPAVVLIALMFVGAVVMRKVKKNSINKR